MATTINFDVSYSQLAVFVSVLPQPFNDWTDQHVAQGFAWRPGSVSFRTMAESGAHTLDIEVVDHMGAVRSDAVRAIDVPFDVPADGSIEIGSIAETVPVTLPPGSFLLRCQFLQTAGAAGQRVRLTFARKDPARFAVVRADSELSIVGDLLTTAQPASG
jgi:hypothetical protein